MRQNWEMTKSTYKKKEKQKQKTNKKRLANDTIISKKHINKQIATRYKIHF